MLPIFYTRLKAATVAAVLVAVSSSPSFATGVTTINKTCSEFTTPETISMDGDFGYSVSLAEGDSLTFDTGTLTSSGGTLGYISGSDYQEFYESGGPYTVKEKDANSVTVVFYSSLYTGGSGTLTCTLATSTEDVAQSFSQSQAVGDLDALYGIISGTARGTLDGTQTNGANGNTFFLSSLGLDNASEDAGLAMAGSAERNLWVSGRYTKIDGDTVDGHSSNLTVGVDFMTSTDTLVGVALSYGDTDYDTDLSGTDGKLEASGLTFAAYFATEMASGLVFDGVLSFGNIEYDIASGGTTGSFDARRIGLGLGVYRQFDWNGMVIEPGANLIVVKENQDAYTDSASTAVAESSFTAGNVSVGPKLYLNGNPSFQPWVSVNAEYTFTNSESAAADTPYHDDFFSARVGFGFTSQLGAGTLAASFDVGAIGEDSFTSYTGELEFSLPF